MCPLRAAEDSETLRCWGSCRGPQLKGEVVSVGASPGVLVAAAVGARASVLSLLGRRVVAQLRVCGVTLRISRVTEPRRGKEAPLLLAQPFKTAGFAADSLLPWR